MRYLSRPLIIYLFFFWGSSLLVAVESSFQEKHAATAGPEIGQQPAAYIKAAAAPVSAVPQFSSQKSYNLGNLIDLALNNNPSTRAAWSQAKAASASVGEARSLYYPWVKAGFNGGYDSNYVPLTTGFNVYNRTQATVFFSLEYILLDFGRRDADVARTIATFNALGLTYQRKLQEIIFAVQKVYFAHEAALWKKKAAETNLAFLSTLADMIARENVTGLSAGPELLKARKQVLEAQYEVESATAKVKNTLGELCVATGLPANTPLQITTTERPVSTKKLRGDANELVRRALVFRPDIAARVAELKASKEATRRAIADFFPVIKLHSDYINNTFGYTATDGNLNGTYGGAGVSGVNGFVMASWDIFDGLERIFKVRQRQEEDKVAERNLEQTKLNTTRDVWTSYNDSLTAEQRVNFAEGYVASAKETFDAVKTAVETGLTNVTDFAESGSNVANADSELASAVADYSTALALLAFSVGTTTPAPSRVPEDLGKPGELKLKAFSF